VCISLYTTVVHNTAQSSSDYLPIILQTNTRAQMLYIGGEGAEVKIISTEEAVSIVTMMSKPSNWRMHMIKGILTVTMGRRSWLI